MALASMICVQLGLAASVGLFDDVGPEGAACLRLERRTWRGAQSITWVRLTYPGDQHRLVGRFRAQQAPRRVG